MVEELVVVPDPFQEELSWPDTISIEVRAEDGVLAEGPLGVEEVPAAGVTSYPVGTLSKGVRPVTHDNHSSEVSGC